VAALLYFRVWYIKASNARAIFPDPCNLTICTRLEVQYPGGALRQLFPDGGLQKTILNEEERARVR